jgi:hypothetical protein
MNKKLLFTTSFLCITTSIPAFASMDEFWQINSGIESGGNYSVMNDEGCLRASVSTSGCNSTAMGKHQILFGNWESQGIVTGSGWHDAQFTEEAAQYGVYSVDDLRNSPGGHQLQDDVAGSLAYGMYEGLNDTTTSYIGQTVNGVTINESALLRGAWHMGPGDMNEWAESGFTVEGLRALDPVGSMLAAQGYDSYEDWNASMMNQMAEMGDVDISELTGGTYVVGGGEYAAAMGIDPASLEDCLPEVNQALAEMGRRKVENTVAMAQDPNLGFSELEEPMGIMSCIDFAFSGSVDILFSVPSLDSILSGLQDFACQKLNQMTGDAMTQMTSSLQEVTSLSTDLGFGPISGLGGVDINFNQGGEPGINWGVTSSNPTIDLGDEGTIGGGTSSIGSPSSAGGSAMTGEGLRRLFK